MIVLGLTGSIGMGKSTAAAMLCAMRIPVHCSDDAVHAALAPGGTGVDAVMKAFPPAAGKSRTAIDRKALRRHLGEAHERWDKLEGILHPLVRGSQQEFLRAQRGLGAPVVALDIPLLFETGAEARVDYTICMTAPAFLQAQRLRARGLAPADYAFRLSRQMPDPEKRRRADFVVQTGLGRGYTYQELQRILEVVTSHESGRFPSQ